MRGKKKIPANIWLGIIVGALAAQLVMMEERLVASYYVLVSGTHNQW